MKKKSKIDMVKILSKAKYKGKHVVLAAGRVFTAKTGKEINKILDMVEKKYPNVTPAITFVPKTDTLIL